MDDITSLPWLPLESNPEIINSFLKNLGVPEMWQTRDIISLEETQHNYLNKGVLAVLLLFPFSKGDDEYCKQQESSSKEHGKRISNLYFLPQTIKNACGLIAVIHAIANNLDVLDMSSESLIMKFVKNTKVLPPREKAKMLEENSDIYNALKSSYPDGKSLCEKCDYHFITLVRNDGMLYELDGRKSTPVLCGATTDETFFKDALNVCKQYMERDPDNINFTALSFEHI